MSGFGQAVESLGDRFAMEVAGAGLSPPDFAGRAVELLEELLSGGWGLAALDEMVRRDLPSQDRVNPNFGQPALTLFHHEDFRLDALCWRPGATSAHHHAFSGAFGVLRGLSLQRSLRFGGVRSTSSAAVELLDGFREEAAVVREGQVRAIEEGPGFAHQVTHVEPGAVTLVLRSHAPLAGTEEWSYLPPSVRVASLDMSHEANQRARFYRFLRHLEPERALELAAAVLADGDPYSQVEMLRVVASGDRNFQRTRKLVVNASPVPEIVQSVVHEASRERLIAAMSKAGSPVARAVLAIFGTMAGFEHRRRLLEELDVNDAEEITARVISKWLLRLGMKPEEETPFELGLAEFLRASRNDGAVSPSDLVAERLAEMGLGPCVLGRIQWPELERSRDVSTETRSSGRAPSGGVTP